MNAQIETTTSLTVSGMTCGSCRTHVSQALAAVPGVRDVNVDLRAGTATVTSQAGVPVDQLIEAVREAGYGAEHAAGTQQAGGTAPNTATHCSR